MLILQGDSGGPLHIVDGDQYRLVGVGFEQLNDIAL
jgi:hypothetical protein